jgi:hypothetical protein
MATLVLGIYVRSQQNIEFLKGKKYGWISERSGEAMST